MGRGLVLLHFGQAGVQIGSALWELFCIEHRLTPDGHLTYDKDAVDLTGFENMDSLFYEGWKSWTPRAVMIDLEPSVIDEIRTGCYRQLWRPTCLITGKEDAANNYGRGNCSIGRQKLEETMDAIRKMAEHTPHLSAFQLVHSHSGGTGSGMTSLVVNHLCEEYGKKFKFSTSVFPSSMYSQSTVDPYNSILHAHSTIETIDCDIIFDNQTLFERCTRNLNIARPSYTDINRVLAQMLGSVFLSHRFTYYGSQHADTAELLTNLVPYPRIHFQTMSYAPLNCRWSAEHEPRTVNDLTRAVFSEDSKTIDFPYKQNAYISCAMLYRGLSSPKPVYDALKVVKGSPTIGANFVDWCPTGFKIGLSPVPPTVFPGAPLAESPQSVCMVAGNLGMRHAWHRNNMKFDMLFSRRSFVHWFVGEGIEESEFIEAREDLAFLEQDYAELMSETIQAVEMVEPPAQETPRTPSHRSMDQNKSLEAESIHSRQIANPEVDEYQNSDVQSNNANTRLRQLMSESRNHHSKPPVVGKYGDIGVLDWAPSPDRLGSPSHSTAHHSLVHVNNGHREHQTSRFSYQSESSEDWSSGRVTREDFRSNHTPGIDKSLVAQNSPGIHRFQHRRPNEGDYSPDCFRSTEVASIDSGLRTTEVSRPTIPRGHNMNNARYSPATSNDTMFPPTNPVMQLHTDDACTEGVYAMLQSTSEPQERVETGRLDVSTGSSCINSQKTKRNHCQHALRRRRCQKHLLTQSPLTAEQMGNAEAPPNSNLASGQPSTDRPCVVECVKNSTLGADTASLTSGIGTMSDGHQTDEQLTPSHAKSPVDIGMGQEERDRRKHSRNHHHQRHRHCQHKHSRKPSNLDNRRTDTERGRTLVPNSAVCGEAAGDDRKKDDENGCDGNRECQNLTVHEVSITEDDETDEGLSTTVTSTQSINSGCVTLLLQ